MNRCREAARRSRPRCDARPVALDSDPTLADQVRAVLIRLRPRHRAVLVLRYMRSLSYQEIAEVLRWSLPRVKVTLYRAKRAFKDVYLELEEGEP